MRIDDMKAFLQAPLDPALTRALPKDDSGLNRIVRPSLTYWQDAWIKLRKNKVAMLGLAIIILYLLLAIFAPVFARYDFASQNAKAMNQWPSEEHLFGTDQAGRDLWVRNWMGARVSLFIGIAVVLINTAIGCVVGGVSGYFGGRVDMLVMRLIDVLYGIPMIILAILIRTVMDSGVFPLVLAMVALGWIGSARLVRGQVLQLKNQEFVMAARTLGVSDGKIILKHMIPNISGILITNMTMAIPQAIFTEAFLSFIGIGIKSPSCSWGSLAQSAIQVYRIHPYQLLIPAFFICTTMLSLNMLGDGLRDALDPRMRGR